MAATSRGDYPLLSEWFRGALTRTTNTTRKPVLPDNGAAAKAVWSDFFFEFALLRCVEGGVAGQRTGVESSQSYKTGPEASPSHKTGTESGASHTTGIEGSTT